MTPLLAVLLSLPCVYWTQGVDTRAALQAAGIKRICVAPDRADDWRAAGFSVTPVSESELAARTALPTPGIIARAGVASPTRSPWIVASGWRFMQSPAGKYAYTVAAGKGALVLAEAAAYGADAIITIDRADVEPAGAMLSFLETLPALDLPPIADFAVVDDGSAVTAEVMNLLARRNLLFAVARAPSSRFPINVKIGDAAYPAGEAADPSQFALKIRRQLTDEQRSLRVYGSEVVICRLTGDKTRLRLHLINYGGRDIEGLRIRVRGTFRDGEAYVAGAGRVALADQVASEGATEFSIARLGTYAVVDLR
jgi:hypothetical protein